MADMVKAIHSWMERKEEPEKEKKPSDLAKLVELLKRAQHQTDTPER